MEDFPFLASLFSFLLAILAFLFSFLLAILPGLLWMGFWFFAVDWRKVWPTLAAGAWAPCVLLGLVAATVWSRIAPSACDCLAFVTIPNFWWQLGSVSTLAAAALFAGWLQGQATYTPPAIEVEPAGGHGHDHGHGHGHDHGHGHGHETEHAASHEHGHGLH